MNQPSTACPICDQTSHFSFSSRDLMFNHFDRYDYNACTNCDLVFQHPLPSAEEISGFYPNDYDVYEEQSRLKKISPLQAAILKRKFGYSHLTTTAIYDFLSTFLNISSRYQYVMSYIENGSLLDIGCGNGRYLNGMQQLGWLVKGVEFNAHAVEVCQKSDLDVHHGDLLSANLPDNSFDVVNLSHVIEHVPDPKALFMEVSRVLKPQGLFIVKTPNNKALGRALFNTNWFANEVPRHLYLFSQKNLVELGKAHHLDLLSIETSSTPKIVLNSLDYVLGNRGKPSKKIWWRRQLAKCYVLLAKYKKQGDEIHAVFRKS